MTAVEGYSMVAGETKRVDVTIRDDAGDTVDVTGAAVTYVIADSEIRVTKTQGSGITIAESVVTVALAPADTAGLAGLYAHEMRIVDGAGDVTTVLVGKVGIARSLIP